MSTKKVFLYLLIIFLAIIPFFWLKPNELNLGGDSSRGYLYNPIAFINDYALYGINPWDIGREMVGYYFVPFSGFLGLILYFVKSSHNLINVFNSFSFVLAFLGVYYSIFSMIKDLDKDLEKRVGFIRTAGIIGGLFYIFSPTMTNWDKALTTFNYIFLDPLMFLLLYKYLSKKKIHYALLAILITFIFAPNFSFIGAPTFFSFFPFVFVFLLSWIYIVKKSPLNFKQIIVLILLFLGTQSFHLIPQVVTLLNPASIAAKRVYSDPTFSYASYFKSTAIGINATYNFLGLPQASVYYGVLFFIFPLVLILALFQKIKTYSDRDIRKGYLLILGFFLILLFFTSGKITNVGLQFYSSLFNIPGFGMFRNFIGQFINTYIFFYSLSIAFGLCILYKKINKKLNVVISVFIIILLFVRGWPLLTGKILYLPTFQSKISTPYIPSNSFKNYLNYIAKIPTDSKILNLPLNDFAYLMVPGAKGGLYMGSSIVGPLTLRQDFQSTNGLDGLSDVFASAVKTKDTKTLDNFIAMLNIQNIFWEKDSFIYEQNFPNFPYQSTQNYIDTTPSAYQALVNVLPISKKIDFGKDIEIFKVNDSTVFPRIFTSNNIIYAENISDTPYLMDKVKNQPNVVISTQDQLSLPFNSITYQAKPVDYLSGLADNLQFHKAVPEVSWKPGSLVYPLIIWKEERSLRKMQGQEKQIYAFLYLSKRVEELGKWSNEIPVVHKEPVLPPAFPLSIIKWPLYNSWEAVLKIYENYALQIIDSINQLPQDQQLSQKIISYEQFEQHRLRLDDVIYNLDSLNKNKIYLKTIVDKMFNNLESDLKVEKIDITHKTYNLTLPENGQGIYSISLSHADPNTSYSSLSINGKLINPNEKGNGIYDFGQVQLSASSEISAILSLRPKNLADGTRWEGLDNVETNNNMDNIVINNTFNNFSGVMTRKIPFIPGKNQYVISFYYNTNNKAFNLTLSDKRIINHDGMTTNTYTTRKLLSSNWKLFQTIYSIDPTTKAVYLQIDNMDLNKKQSILIKDFEVYSTDFPIITFTKYNFSKQTIPNITFQRINPTKYKIFVKDASGPYVLTFLQAFSKNWKLYFVPHVSKPNFSVVKSYFNGSVSEGGHKNLFISNDMFETWGMKQIAEENHMLGEGYANSWIITPNDTKGKKNYQLIIELSSQRGFYIGSFITIIFLVVILLTLITMGVLYFFEPKK